METLVSIVGGVGLFLLGMAVMTDGLKALAGTALKTVMEKAAATPLLGTFWGAVITLIVQSSSATTMTTIGLVSAGLLTFPQGLSLVFGANIGTTGTGWLVAAFGVRISLTAASTSRVEATITFLPSPMRRENSSRMPPKAWSNCSSVSMPPEKN